MKPTGIDTSAQCIFLVLPWNPALQLIGIFFFFFFLFYQNNTSYHHILDVDHASFTKLGNYPFLKIFLSYHYYLNSKESGLVSFVLVVNFVQNNISIWRQKVNFIRIKLCMSCMVNFPPLNWTIWPYSLTVYPLC